MKEVNKINIWKTRIKKICFWSFVIAMTSVVLTGGTLFYFLSGSRAIAIAFKISFNVSIVSISILVLSIIAWVVFIILERREFR